MSYRASYYVTVVVDAPVVGDNFEQALEAAKKKEFKNLVNLKPGVDLNDYQVRLYQVWNPEENGGM